MPERMVWRQPFPGPGLAIRIVGDVTADRLQILRSADAILQEEIRRAGLYRELWQSFAVLPAIRSVGVQGDERTYAYPIVIRAVTSQDAMTAFSGGGQGSAKAINTLLARFTTVAAQGDSAKLPASAPGLAAQPSRRLKLFPPPTVLPGKMSSAKRHPGLARLASANTTWRAISPRVADGCCMSRRP